MYTFFSAKYKSKQDAVNKILEAFDDSGRLIGKGKRNVVKAFEFDGEQYNVKSFKIPHLINKIVYRFFRMSKAKRSFLYAERLLSLGILSPYPVAYIEEKTSFFFLKSYYISKQQQYDLTFRDLIENSKYVGNTDILKAFTRFTFRLHEQNVLFNDHSPGNTLIKITEKGYDFYLVDLNRMQFKPLDFNARMKNFSRLTPKKEMVKFMADEYAKLIGSDKNTVFDLMWKYTQEFQHRFHKKKALKKKLLFRS